MKQYLEKLLHGDKKESMQAKKDLIKDLDKKISARWRSEDIMKKDRENFKKEVDYLYKEFFTLYGSLQTHNKSNMLSFLSHSLFYFKQDVRYFELFLEYIRGALQDSADGNLRQMAVKTTSNSYAASLTGLLAKNSKKAQEDFTRYFGITKKHLTLVFDTLESIIEKDESLFPLTIEEMKPSIMKSHLLYIFEFDRFGILEHLSGLYEEEDFFKDNGTYDLWKSLYEDLLRTHINIKNFIVQVPRYDLHKYDQDRMYEGSEYDQSEIPTLVKHILDSKEEEGIPSDEFFSGESVKDFLGGFSAPPTAYFDIMELMSECDDKDVLFETFNLVYGKALSESVSGIYWYDLIDYILSKLDDDILRFKILGEAIKKLASKVDISSPVGAGNINVITYGFHEHRPIFRILASFAIGNQECGNREIAKAYYEFLLKLNPRDNQGIRYLLAALYSGRPASYVGELFDEGNRTHKWDKVENFLEEENMKYHFWDEPKE